MSIRLLHFADAHIDMANHGRHDPKTGLPIRVVDFLNSLDAIVQRAIDENVDLVIFAGDAYRNQRPHPRFQQQWQQRMMRLSAAGIPTILVIGNHDTSPAAGEAHALQEFATLNVPHIHIADKPRLYTPDELGINAQVLAIPWAQRSRFLRRDEMIDLSEEELREKIEGMLSDRITGLIDAADPKLPLILTAHATVSGAVWGSERQVMLGRDFVLSGSVVGNKKFDYVALGHIHAHQDVNKGQHPPIIYAGSIERVDFGELKEDKGYVLANVKKKATEWEFVKLNTRPFNDIHITLKEADNFMATIMKKLPAADKITGAICRLRLSYPRILDDLLDEREIGRHYDSAFSLQISRFRTDEKRTRLGDALATEQLSPSDLLSRYWQTKGMSVEETASLQQLARETFKELEF